jgi:hypothetical protein
LFSMQSMPTKSSETKTELSTKYKRHGQHTCTVIITVSNKWNGRTDTKAHVLKNARRIQEDAASRGPATQP